jgi:hypothetical protein
MIENKDFQDPRTEILKAVYSDKSRNQTDE